MLLSFYWCLKVRCHYISADLVHILFGVTRMWSHILSDVHGTFNWSTIKSTLFLCDGFSAVLISNNFKTSFFPHTLLLLLLPNLAKAPTVNSQNIWNLLIGWHESVNWLHNVIFRSIQTCENVTSWWQTALIHVLYCQWLKWLCLMWKVLLVVMDP